MVVLRKVNAELKSAHALCNVGACFQVMYIDERGVDRNADTLHHVYEFVSQKKGEGFGVKRLNFV